MSVKLSKEQRRKVDKMRRKYPELCRVQSAGAPVRGDTRYMDQYPVRLEIRQ